MSLTAVAEWEQSNGEWIVVEFDARPDSAFSEHDIRSMQSYWEFATEPRYCYGMNAGKRVSQKVIDAHAKEFDNAVVAAAERACGV
jgi:hypothetical protein